VGLAAVVPLQGV